MGIMEHMGNGLYTALLLFPAVCGLSLVGFARLVPARYLKEPGYRPLVVAMGALYVVMGVADVLGYCKVVSRPAVFATLSSSFVLFLAYSVTCVKRMARARKMPPKTAD